jgi:hypothetical protein
MGLWSAHMNPSPPSQPLAAAQGVGSYFVLPSAPQVSTGESTAEDLPGHAQLHKGSQRDAVGQEKKKSAYLGLEQSQ